MPKGLHSWARVQVDKQLYQLPGNRLGLAQLKQSVLIVSIQVNQLVDSLIHIHRPLLQYLLRIEIDIFYFCNVFLHHG